MARAKYVDNKLTLLASNINLTLGGLPTAHYCYKCEIAVHGSMSGMCQRNIGCNSSQEQNMYFGTLNKMTAFLQYMMCTACRLCQLLRTV